MSCSPARLTANRKNAELSTGPRTDQGKAIARANALKHGLTGAGVVLPEADAAEVERRAAAFARELEAAGEVGHALARRAALNSVRMERGADQQTAALADRVRRAEADFVPPEGADEAEAARLRSEAARIAMFDPSREATLSRRYEAAAERAFFRCLKELREMNRPRKADAPAAIDRTTEEMLGSFFAAQAEARRMDAEFDALYAGMDVAPPRKPANSPLLSPMGGVVDVPISIGRRR